jgi:hypothetical protein
VPLEHKRILSLDLVLLQLLAANASTILLYLGLNKASRL